MEPNQINADNYPIDKTRVIKLIPRDKLKKFKKGVQLFTVGGKETIVGKEELDCDTGCFGRSKYGELITTIKVISTKK